MNINELQSRIKGWLSKVSMIDTNSNQLPVRLSVTTTLYIIATVTLIASLSLLVFPYILFPQFYVPKTDTSMGYVAPNTHETWIILITALILLVIAIFTIIKLKQKEPNMFNRSLLGFFLPMLLFA